MSEEEKREECTKGKRKAPGFEHEQEKNKREKKSLEISREEKNELRREEEGKA